MEHSSSKWNTHIKIGTLIKMEYSSKWNTHIKIGTLIKMEYSSKWNTHIVKRNSSNGTPHQGTLHLWLLLA